VLGFFLSTVGAQYGVAGGRHLAPLGDRRDPDLHHHLGWHSTGAAAIRTRSAAMIAT